MQALQDTGLVSWSGGWGWEGGLCGRILEFERLQMLIAPAKSQYSKPFLKH